MAVDVTADVFWLDSLCYPRQLSNYASGACSWQEQARSSYSVYECGKTLYMQGSGPGRSTTYNRASPSQVVQFSKHMYAWHSLHAHHLHLAFKPCTASFRSAALDRGRFSYMGGAGGPLWHALELPPARAWAA